MSKLVALDALGLKAPNEARFTQMKWVEPTVKTSLKVLGMSKPGVELTLVSRLVNAMRVIALHVLTTTGLGTKLTTPRRIADLPDYDARILETFLDFAVALGVVERRADEMWLASKFVAPLSFDAAAFVTAATASEASRWQEARESASQDPRRDAVADFVFIVLLVGVRSSGSFDEARFAAFGVPARWGRLVADDEYGAGMTDLCQYILELLRVDLKEKFKFSQDESFFSKIAHTAFRDMMKDHFVAAGKEIVARHGVRSILDIGCGYGDYLEECQKFPGVERVVGVERQGVIAKACAERFKDVPNVTIVNADVGSALLRGPFHMAILSFVLFYFPEHEKVALLRRIRELLSDDGVLVLCQYFPNIAGIQEWVAEQRGEYSMKTRTGMYFMTKILLAEALLNDTLTQFQGAERWDSFHSALADAGFRVRSITNADELYYSFFLIAEKSHSATMQQGDIQEVSNA